MMKRRSLLVLAMALALSAPAWGQDDRDNSGSNSDDRGDRPYGWLDDPFRTDQDRLPGTSGSAAADPYGLDARAPGRADDGSEFYSGAKPAKTKVPPRAPSPATPAIPGLSPLQPIDPSLGGAAGPADGSYNPLKPPDVLRTIPSPLDTIDPAGSRPNVRKLPPGDGPPGQPGYGLDGANPATAGRRSARPGASATGGGAHGLPPPPFLEPPPLSSRP
jgi:hypothetical protein